MTSLLISLLVVVASFLFVLFYFLNKRVNNIGRRMGTLYANIDIIHKNQEELLAQNLRMFHDTRQKDKK
jgi:uncharacterized protein YoxC